MLQVVVVKANHILLLVQLPAALDALPPAEGGIQLRTGLGVALGGGLAEGQGVGLAVKGVRDAVDEAAADAFADLVGRQAQAELRAFLVEHVVFAGVQDDVVGVGRGEEGVGRRGGREVWVGEVEGPVVVAGVVVVVVRGRKIRVIEEVGEDGGKVEVGARVVGSFLRPWNSEVGRWVEGAQGPEGEGGKSVGELKLGWRERLHREGERAAGI